MSDINPKRASTNTFAAHLSRAQAATDESGNTLTKSDPVKASSLSTRLALEIEGTSPHSWEDASQRALANADLIGPAEFDIIYQTGIVEYGKIKEYRIGLRVYSDDPTSLTNIHLQRQQSNIVGEPTDAENFDPFLERTVQSESQKQLAEHYQTVRNLGEKEKGDKE